MKMKIKRFNEINEDNNQYQDTKLVMLIDDDGNKINKKGYAKEGVGIFDYESNQYPSGIDEHGNVYASQVIGDDILQLNGEDIVPGIKMGEIYKPVHEHLNDFVYESNDIIIDDNISIDDLLKSAKLLKDNINFKELIIYLNDNDINYNNMSDIEMIIKYLNIINK